MTTKRKAKKAANRYHRLRSEVQGMPLGMAGAMLSSLDEMTIVTGQYTDSRGGSCPLLAAWQSSNRTVRLQHSFPATWDVFCGIKHPRHARPATRHEISILRMLLEERLMPPGERPMVDRTPGRVELPLVAQPAETVMEQEQWSCDWEEELAELGRERTAGFRRTRRVVEQDDLPVSSGAWREHVSGLMMGHQSLRTLELR